MPPPNAIAIAIAIAIVELVEQSDLRIPANIVNCDPDSLTCGMPLRVCFESQGACSIPVFYTPCSSPIQPPEPRTPGSVRFTLPFCEIV